MVVCRPSGEVTVQTRVGLSNRLVVVRPLSVVLSVSEVKASGSVSVAGIVVRFSLIERLNPLGVRAVIPLAMGLSMPKRGSGPRVSAPVVPSGRVGGQHDGLRERDAMLDQHGQEVGERRHLIVAEHPAHPRDRRSPQGGDVP